MALVGKHFVRAEWARSVMMSPTYWEQQLMRAASKTSDKHLVGHITG